MKVFLIGPAYPYRGGIADTNESLYRALEKDGHNVKIINFKIQYPNFLFPGKTQFSNNSKPNQGFNSERIISSISPINWLLTAKKINTEKPDLIIIRHWIPFMSPCLGSIAHLTKKSIKKIALCDNVLPHEKRFGDKLLTQFFLSAFDGVMTLSEEACKKLDVFNLKISKDFFPHPINDNLGEIIPKKDACKYLELNENKNYLLFFGLIRKYKGLDLTIKSFAEAQKKLPNLVLLIVGEFYDEKEKYTSLVKELNLSDSVVFIGQFIPTTEIKYYFSASDMLIQTYLNASQSGVTQIAYHFHCPMLVTNVGGMSEMVENEKVGYVVSKNQKEIGEAIVNFYEKSRANDFKQNIEKEKKKFSWDGFVKKLIALYKEV